jgi:hypothetical protein
LIVKRLPVVLLSVLLVAGGATASFAQVYGQFTSAETLPVNGHLFGGYLHASENVVGLLAQLRLSFYPEVDFGFQGGLERIDSGGNHLTTIRLGGDFKYLAAHAGPSLPFDVAVGAALGVETGDNINVLSVGPTAVASRTLQIGSNGGVTPYAGLALLFSNVEVQGSQNSDFSVPIRLGSEFRLAPELRISAELQLRLADEFNDHIGFATGVNLPF